MTMTETKTFKRTNTKTKTHRHRQRQIQSASKTQYCNVWHIFQKPGVQGFKILYWLSSCDDKDKDKDKDKDTILCIIMAEYFPGVNIF